MNEILESRIEGEADIIFGGKIGSKFASIQDVNEPHIVLRLGEVQEKSEVGVPTKFNFINDCQVNMIFTNPKSIDVVIGYLEKAKKELNEESEDK